MGDHFRLLTPSLFVDVDDVVLDFTGGFFAEFGVACDAVPKNEMWRLIDHHGEFFRHLPVCPGAEQFIRSILPLRPMFLTACAEHNFADVASQKCLRLREVFGNVPMIPSPGSAAKEHYIHMPGDVLIDDYHRNIKRWEKAGGFGILHDGDFAATMQRLCEYLWPTTPTALGMSNAPSVDLKTTSRATMTDTLTASLLGAATVNLPEEKPFRITPA